MNSAYLLTGGNLGNRKQTLETARKFIATEVGKIVAVSSLYETVSWGIPGQPDFLNQVLEVRTGLLPHELMNTLLSIENKMGRVRAQKNASRVIDIDILFFNDDIIDEAGINIPHPEIPNRKFALIPLHEIAPRLLHPRLGKTIENLLSTSPDTLEVRRISE